MKDKQLVIYGNFMFLLDRYIYESDEMFYFRINYIYNNIKNYKQNNIDELIGLSKKISCEPCSIIHYLKITWKNNIIIKFKFNIWYRVVPILRPPWVLSYG